ncbi:MAG: hypothetical protein ACXABY_17785 [Candidatus Thorarchaeota archaeon]|jgi:hypothetical protein
MLKGKTMDSGLGKLEPISEDVAKAIEYQQQKAGTMIPSVFHVGEELQIKGSLFHIQSIGRKKMKLKILRRPR